MRIRTLGGIALLALCISATAQDRASAAPQDLLEAFDVRVATTQDLALPDNLRRAFEVRVVLGGRSHTLVLQPNSVLAADFQLLVDDGNALRAVPTPTETTYQGVVEGTPGGHVAATLYERQLWAHISLPGETWTVQPASDGIATMPRQRHIVFRKDAVTRTPQCGVSGPSKPVPIDAPRSGNAMVVKDCQIALDCETLFYQWANSSVPETQARATSIINACDLIYRRDVGICYTITTILVRTTPTYLNGPEVGCCGASCGLLPEMVTRWNANHGNITRDVAHMFAGGTSTIAAGCAFLGVICDTASAYGVSSIANANFGVNVGVVAHELGHNWNACHCDQGACISNPCRIMCSGIGACGPYDSFGPGSIAIISAFRDTRTCLGDCNGCSDPAEYGFFGTACAGSGSGAGPNCISLNYNNTLAGFVFNPPDFDVGLAANSGAGVRAIQSLDLYCEASSPINIPVALHAASGGEPGAVLGSATMNIGTAQGTYTATFSPAIVLPANTDFFVVFRVIGSTMTVPISSSGTPTAWCFRPGTSWFCGQQGFEWNYRLNCLGNNAPPVLSNVGLPKLGGNYSIMLSSARPNTPASALLGLQTDNIDLGIIGAPQCSLYVKTLLIVQPSSTDGNGSATYPQRVPNDQTLCGLPFYHQIVLIDPVNQLQIVTTRRGVGKVGN